LARVNFITVLTLLYLHTVYYVLYYSSYIHSTVRVSTAQYVYYLCSTVLYEMIDLKSFFETFLQVTNVINNKIHAVYMMAADGKPTSSSEDQISLGDIIDGLRKARTIGRSNITVQDRTIQLLLFPVSSITDNLFHLETHDCEDSTLIVLAFEDYNKDKANEDTNSKKPNDDRDDNDDSDSKTLMEDRDDSNDSDSKTLKEDSDDDNNDMKICRAQFL